MARNLNSYMGRPPRTAGTGPKNLAKNEAAAKSQVRGRQPKASVARTPSVRPNLASARAGRIPGGAGSGIPKATTPMASAPRKVINKPKTRAGNAGRIGTSPRADGASKI